jgi:hypothetical protein
VADVKGPGRLLGLCYGFFALAATGRASYQLVTKASEAPVAYTLSAFAAGVYVVGAVLMIGVERRPALARSAATLCIIELLGVVSVGTASVVDPEAFPDASVWSGYGVGYGFVPVLLPVLALWWLRSQARIRGGGQSPRRSA